MREDFAKLLVERERFGSGNKNNVVRKNRRLLRTSRKDPESLENLSSKDSMQRFNWSSGNLKSFNENLNPLKRFLHGQIGRPWDKVYEELRKHIDPRSTIQNHILEHLWDYVKRDVILDEKDVPFCLSYWNGYQPLYSDGPGYGLYVHPVSGLLCSAPRRPKYQKDGPDPNKFKANDGTECYREDGIWYRIVLISNGFSRAMETVVSRDQEGGIVHCQRPILDAWEESFRKEKRQLSTADLKKYNLSNTKKE